MEFILQEYNCPLCNSDKPNCLFVKQGFSIVKCNKCNFVYVNPRIKNENLGALYRHNYFTSKDYGYSGYEQEKRLRVKNFKRWLDDSASFFPANNNILALDVGCAAGYCLDVMMDKGWKAEGLELDEEMYNQLSTAGYNVFNSELIEFNSDKKYSVITLFDVIEHIPDVDAVFKKLYQLLDENGVIILVTPDHNSFQQKLFRKQWFQYKPIEHIQYFTSNTISAFGKRNGFKILFEKRSGQYADTQFILNRLKYYRFTALSGFFESVFSLFRFRNRFFYIDTGSRMIILKKI